jgi:hypothetical protein
MSASSTATDTLAAHAGITTDTPKGTTDAARQGIRWIRPLVFINLVLVALQPLSAGFFLSGYDRAVTVHAVVAQALLFGALIQAVTAIILWRLRRVPAWVVRASLGLLVIVFFQNGLGYKKLYWLHVPIGVGIFAAQTRLASRLATLRRTTGAQS